MSRRSWSLYGGVTYAPVGSILEPGWRVRAVAGGGRYRYESSDVKYRGTSQFADLLVGYQVQLGLLTLKGFAGAALIDHRLKPIDFGNEARGSEIGAKAVVEMWLALGHETFLSFDSAATTAHKSYSVDIRLGRKVAPDWTAGIEAGMFGNAEGDGARGGAFLRRTFDRGELRISGGRSGAHSAETGDYVALNWLQRF